VWPGILAEATGLDLTVGPAHAGAAGAALLAAAGASHAAGETREQEALMRRMHPRDHSNP